MLKHVYTLVYKISFVWIDHHLNKTATEDPQSHCIDSWAGIHPGHEDGISPVRPIIKEQTDLECSIVATVPQVDGA